MEGSNNYAGSGSPIRRVCLERNASLVVALLAVLWLAGGGVKGGVSYGATDEFGYKAVENRTSVHDIQATVLHLMGLDHTRLTYRFNGRDFRLTDVAGNVIRPVLA